MNLDNSIKRIDKYIRSDKNLPIIVDVSNIVCMKLLIDHYTVGSNKIMHSKEYAQKDCFPLMADMKARLSASNDIVFLDDLSFFLLIQGSSVLTRELKSMLEIQTEGKLIIVTYICGTILQTFDQRLFHAGRITVIDGAHDALPTLNFISSKLPKPDVCLQGIQNVPQIITFMEDGHDEVSIITKKKKTDFPDSEFQIQEFNSVFQVISGRFPELATLGESVGTEDNWKALLKDMQEYEEWSSYIAAKFTNIHSLSQLIGNFENYTTFEKWVYFLSLRTFGAKGNDYLVSVVSKSESYDSFITNCFTLILSYSVSDNDYWKAYDERKAVLSRMQEYTEEIDLFRKQAYGKEAYGIYYMTDLNKSEKEQTIDLLARYGMGYGKNELISILQHTYPDLALYLLPYYTNNIDFDRYIETYKYCKVTNTITEDFKKMVEKQATEHQYITWLQPRSLVIDGLKKEKDKTHLFFMDAMGVEFLGYLQNKCFENNLLFKAVVGRCDLPSITSINKGFVTEISELGCKVTCNSDLDTLKHEGNSSYNYENVKIPIHIVEELNILNCLIDQLKTLAVDEYAYVISDHGATRLAVINETETKWEVSEKGKHSGRCCPKSDVDTKPAFATEENDFWCLANYDRFKGGRKALVEVHGGATIEEVAVPIISIQKQNHTIECSLKDNKPIVVSFKKKAQMILFVNAKSDNVYISVNGQNYKAEKTDTPYHYIVVMPEVTKAGTYSFNVYVEEILSCKNLTFEVKKEGANERKFF